MKCRVCGADYDSRLNACPFCMSENEVKAADVLEEELKAYDQETEEMIRELPKRLAMKIGKRIFAGIVLVGVVLLILVILAEPIVHSRKELKDAKVKEHKENMEYYLGEEEYEALHEYLLDHNLYGKEYTKYDEVDDVYFEYEGFMDNLEWLSRTENDGRVEENGRDVIFYTLYDAFYCLVKARKGFSDMIPRMNEEYLEYFYNQVVEELEIFGYDAELCETVSKWENVNEQKVRVYVEDAYQTYFYGSN